MRVLLLVESPNKCQSIKQLLRGTQYDGAVVMASVGHILEIANGGKYCNCGIDPTNNFKANYQISSDKKEVVNKKVTFSGGEPLMQVDALIDIVKKLEGFDIAVYTGHEFEEVPQELLDNITYIKTGSFKEELKSTVKPYVGSTNQEFRRVK